MIARMFGDELPGDEAEDSGFAADSSLLDPVDRLRGLASMDALLECASRSRGQRLVVETASPRTAVERHWREAGHQLAHGCCAPYVESARTG